MPPSTTRGQRDCRCPRVRHEHGTRRAYQRDRCRCTPCRRAHATHARDRRLRHAEQTWNGGNDWTSPERSVLQLRALAADGWTLADLAPLLGLTRSGVHMLRATRCDRMLSSTAQRVDAVFRRLDVPVVTPARKRAKQRARAHGWLPSLALDEMGKTEIYKFGNPHIMMLPFSEITNAVHQFIYTDSIDEIAVERAVAGDQVPLNEAELSQARDTLERMGLSAREIGERLGVSGRTVQRRRASERAA